MEAPQSKRRRSVTLYKIKPLEWQQVKDSIWKMNTIFGPWYVIKEEKCLGPQFRFRSDSFPELDAAKALAEAWYRKRLTPALEEVGE